MEYKLQIKNKKFLTVTVLTLFLLSATAISSVSASAELDPTRIPGQTSIDDSSELISENPTLYTSLNSESNNPSLVAAQTQSDDLACIIALVACVSAIASLAIFVSRRQT